MRKSIRTLIALLCAGTILSLTASAALAASFHPIVIDGDLDDWMADELMETEAGTYDLYVTWDADNIYLGLSGAYLGDDPLQDQSFFVCLDTDLIPGSGAGADGYGQVNFDTALFAPEVCYYFAGGAGWYEWSIWNGASWDWMGWRNDGTYYNWPGNPAPNPGSELTIIRSDILAPAGVGMVAWLTNEESPILLASWPTPNNSGLFPTLTHFYHFPSLADGFEPDDSVLTDHLVINEFKAKDTEQIEIYNPTDTDVDLTGWYLTDGEGNETLSGILPAGGYLAVATTLDLSNDGDEIFLVSPFGEVDGLAYGFSGAAPIEISSAAGLGDFSIQRVPNGTDTDDHARDFNMSRPGGDTTFGGPNNAAGVLLGSSVVINEVNAYQDAGDEVSFDFYELYNPLTATVSTAGWYATDGGDGLQAFPFSDTIPAGSWKVYSGTLFIGYSDPLYLWTDEGIRVDQITADAPGAEYGSLQRICDGDGPNDGYNWPASGGDVTLFELPTTYSRTNTPGPVDMAILKAGPYVIPPGGPITYTLSYWTALPMPLTPIVITDTLPAGVEFITYTAEPTLTLIGTDPLVWDAGVRCGLPYGVITISGYVSNSIPVGTVLTNTAQVWATGEVTPSDNTAVWTTTVAGMDLSVAKSGSSGPIWPGNAITYTVDYILAGTDPAFDLVISDTFPADFTLATFTAPDPLTCIDTLDGLLCSAAVVTQSGQIEISGTIVATPTTYFPVNTVTVSASNDANPANNYAEVTTPLVLPIQEVQGYTFTSPYEGEVVWVSGVVVAGTGEIGYAGDLFVIEDPLGGPWSGVAIYNNGAFTDVVEGDLVVLAGLVNEYYGMTEVDISGPEGYLEVLVSGHPLPDPAVLSTGVFTTASPLTAEPYEGVLLEFQAATVISDDLGFGEWLLDDGSGSARADDSGRQDGDLTYTPQLGDRYGFIRGIGWYSFNDYKLEPRYDADIDLDYAVLLMYHDLEDVVHSGEAVYLAGSFNGWDPLATPMFPNNDDSVFSVTVTVPDTGTYEYKYIVYTDTVPGGPANWNWLQSANRAITVTGSGTEAHDYRYIQPGYVVLQWPPATTTTAGLPTEPIYGQIWADDLTSRAGPPRALLAEVGFGSDPDPANWTVWEAMTWGSQQGNNDEFWGVLTPTVAGVYSYVVRFNGNWGLGNPYDMWSYGDLDGVYPGEPFEIENAGVLTVLEPPCEAISAAGLGWMPLTPTAGLPVTFTAVITGGTGPFTYTWDTGDGGSGSGQTFVYTYTTAGTYTVALTVTNPCSEVVVQKEVTIAEAAPPQYTIYLPLVLKGYP